MNVALNVFRLSDGAFLTTFYIDDECYYALSNSFFPYQEPKFRVPHVSEEFILAMFDYPPLDGMESASPQTTWPTPECEGYWWAKWRKADQGDPMTAEYETYLPLDSWGIVEVYDNLDSLRVFLHGVIDSQSLENFIWGPAVTEKAP